MGMWAFEPWDNDGAADWFGDLMDKTKLRAEWLKGIAADPADSPDVVRAAGALFVMLGRVYVWPVAAYDADLEKAIAAVASLETCDEYREVPELLQHIRNELEELKSRRKPRKPDDMADASSKSKPWWAFWK
jgi:hypothetical protein